MRIYQHHKNNLLLDLDGNNMELDFSTSIQNLGVAINFCNVVIADPNTQPPVVQQYKKYLQIFTTQQMLNMDTLVANCG